MSVSEALAFISVLVGSRSGFTPTLLFVIIVVSGTMAVSVFILIYIMLRMLFVCVCALVRQAILKL